MNDDKRITAWLEWSAENWAFIRAIDKQCIHATELMSKETSIGTRIALFYSSHVPMKMTHKDTYKKPYRSSIKREKVCREIVTTKKRPEKKALEWIIEFERDTV
jgi:hypothetical protein